MCVWGVWGFAELKKNKGRKNKLLVRTNLCEQFAKLRGEFLPVVSASAAEQTARWSRLSQRKHNV